MSFPNYKHGFLIHAWTDNGEWSWEIDYIIICDLARTGLTLFCFCFVLELSK